MNAHKANTFEHIIQVEIAENDKNRYKSRGNLNLSNFIPKKKEDFNMLTSIIRMVFRGGKVVCFLFIYGMIFFPVLSDAQTEIDLVNPSFELPYVGKIKGWDGPGTCSDPAWAEATDDIPGWTSDVPVWDSGVETDYTPTDGDYTAFMMGGDTAVYQMTDHVIEEGDDIELVVDARITYAATLFDMILFYEENGTRVPLAWEEWELTDAMEEYYASFSAADYPEAIGKNLGIWFDNVSDSASWMGLDNVRLYNSKVNAVEGEQTNAMDFSLSQNYPNPFNPTTTISYCLKGNGKVRLTVYDLTGKEVAVIVDDIQTVGNHEVQFDGANLTSGIYFYKLQTAEKVITWKMTLIK